MKRLVDVYPYSLTENGPLFLIVKRSPEKIYAHQWRMIGGKRRDGETAWEAVLRELKEETGFTPERFWTVPAINQFYEPDSDTIHFIPAFAAAVPERSELKLDEEHTGHEWIKIEQVSRYIRWPEQERIMKLIHKIVLADGIIEDWEIEIT